MSAAMTDQDPQIIDLLQQLVHQAKTAALPLESRWLDAEQAAALLGFSYKTFLQSIACLPGFPRALRIDGKGKPRWKASEVLTWAEQERDRVTRPARRRA